MAKVIGIMGLAGAGKDTAAQFIQRGLVGVGLANVSIGKFAEKPYEIAEFVFSGEALYRRRDLKEAPHFFDREDFEARVQFGIDSVLGDFLTENKRAELYTLMVESCEQFQYQQHSLSREQYKISPRQFLQHLGTEAGRKMDPDLWVKAAVTGWKKQSGVVLVTDPRFHNEVDVLDQFLFVKRPGVAPVHAHPSEELAAAIDSGVLSVPGIEFIDNDGSLEDFEVECATLACSYATLFAEAK
jgi:hypothetical protein